MKFIASVISILLAVIGIAFLQPVINNFDKILEYIDRNPDQLDAISVATEIGRLDFMSGLLAVLGLILAIYALFGFGYIRREAHQIAKKTAEDLNDETSKEAKRIAEQKINEYIQEELPAIIEEYREMVNGAITEEFDPDAIAASAGDER